MRKYILYFKYVVRHKWYVFLECLVLGIPLRGLLHDLSKFRPSEFIPYARHFYGKNYDMKDMEIAWLHHVHRNKHHPEYWVSTEIGSGKQMPNMMPDKYIREMVADWKGCGHAKGKGSPKDDPYKETREWYSKSAKLFALSPYTRLRVEQLIGYNM